MVAERPDPRLDDPRLDPDLIDDDPRNVVDRYKGWRMEAIIADLDTRRHPFHIAIENWEHDLNIGSIVRTANAFNVEGFHIVGRRRWNSRGAMVTNRYLHGYHHPTVDEFARWAEADDLPLIGVDNLAGSTAIEGATLPKRCVLVFGQERYGLSAEMRAAVSVVLHITQYGSTRSINAAAAAAIAMHTWIRQHADITSE